MEDERKIAAVLEALDALLDRCEDTAHPRTRDRLTGIRLKRKQFWFIEAIWNHESLSDLDTQSPRTWLSLPGTKNSSLGGFMQRRLSHNYSEDGCEDEDEENVIESSEEDCEYWSDESQVVRHTRNEEPRGDEQVSQFYSAKFLQ
ncbi:hypothetical protein RAB80_003793 [Fusarium oxysporum f. sp. vasinfectum]|uniref:Uncharacterized protein n=1 Tax=Fusarium oxysporum f. sp. vasinfectum 25433 TaxID=1089449 RepID=X0KP74_FUSOX|nr:hypothetical protein FOTG_16267 [Fusarium oxysporum f. sp. vasinfectum 25433]KAK2682000.1 hypothetical protein RAB80_003793 [Fusarium oxysporum f. sp. vasinfectum]KAK2933563.1 hypothetical protein FoTM2_004805 [Fusarium oxysporum f. sp. vasinfectum]